MTIEFLDGQPWPGVGRDQPIDVDRMDKFTFHVEVESEAYPRFDLDEVGVLDPLCLQGRQRFSNEARIVFTFGIHFAPLGAFLPFVVWPVIEFVTGASKDCCAGIVDVERSAVIVPRVLVTKARLILCFSSQMVGLSGVIRRRASMNAFATGPVLSTASTGIELRKPSVVTLHTTTYSGSRASASETAASTNPVVIAAFMGLVGRLCR